MTETKNFDKPHLNRIAKEVVEREFRESVIKLTNPFDFGEVNFTALIATEQRMLVVRLNPEDGLDVFQKESWAIKLAAQVNIPTPPVLYLGELEGVAISIFPYIDGKNGELHSDKELIWQQLGSYSRKIHQISVNGFGEQLIDTETHSFSDTWKRYLQYNIDSLNHEDVLIGMRILNKEISLELRNRFLELSQKDFQFGMSHGDLSEKNTIVDADNRVWLIDWGCVHAQLIPHFDFETILAWYSEQHSPEFAAFLNGYGMTREEFETILPEIHNFSVLQAVDKLRWAIDRSPENIEKFSKRLIDKVKGM